MYTDEEMDEMGANMDAQRERSERQRACPHLDVSEEAGSPSPNGAVPVYAVCHDCGLETPTGRYDSVL